MASNCLALLLLSVVGSDALGSTSNNNGTNSTPTPSGGNSSGLVRIDPYYPDELITWVHENVPRYGGATNEFPTTFPDELSDFTSVAAFTGPYSKGVFVPAAIFIIIGIVLFSVLLLAQIIACARCCRGKQCRRKRSTYDAGAAGRGRCSHVCRIEATVVVFALVNTGLLLAAIAYLPRFGEGLDSSVSVAGYISTLVDALYELTGTNTTDANGVPPLFTYTFPNGVTATQYSVEAYSSDATAYAYAMNNAAPALIPNPAAGLPKQPSTIPNPNKALIAPLAAAMGPFDYGVDQAVLALTCINEKLQPPMADLQAAIPTVKRLLMVGGLSVVVLVACFMFVQTTLLCRSRCACGLYKTLAPFTLLLTALVWAAAGVFLSVSLLGSDFCVEGNLNMNNYWVQRIEGNHTDRYTIDNPKCVPGPPVHTTAVTVSYYCLCGAYPELANVTDTAYAIVSSAGAALTPITSGISALSAQVAQSPAAFPWATTQVPPALAGAPLPQPFNTTYLQAYSNDMTATSNNINTLSQILECQPNDAALSELLNGLCNDSIVASIKISRVLIAAAVLLAIQLFLSMDLCCYHPGDDAAWVSQAEEEGAASSAAKTGASDDVVLRSVAVSSSASAPKIGQSVSL